MAARLAGSRAAEEVELEDELELEGEDGVGALHEDTDTDEEEGAAAASFFRAQRTTRRKQKRALGKLPGGDPKELADRVHKLLNRTLSSPPSFPAYTAQYPEWLSALACGCSVLLHGFGSKRVVLNDLASQLAASAPVVVLEGSSSTARVRDLLLMILEQVLPPHRSRCAQRPTELRLPPNPCAGAGCEGRPGPIERAAHQPNPGGVRGARGRQASAAAARLPDVSHGEAAADAANGTQTRARGARAG